MEFKLNQYLLIKNNKNPQSELKECKIIGVSTGNKQFKLELFNWDYSNKSTVWMSKEELESLFVDFVDSTTIKPVILEENEYGELKQKIQTIILRNKRESILKQEKKYDL